MAVISFKTTLVKKEKDSSDADRFFFKKPRTFTYQAGQYIKMWMEIENPDARGVTRYFTLSSSPTDDYLLITTRIIKSSFKLALGKLEIGAKVKMRGSWGDFTLDQAQGRPIVFLSGGIGITPFHSMIKYVSDKNLDIPITLFCSYKTPDEIFFVDKLNDITAVSKNIKMVVTITQPENTEWKGETGRITTDLLQKHLDSFSKYVYYIAGPDPMVEGIEKLLLSLKIPKDQILTDGFPGY